MKPALLAFLFVTIAHAGSPNISEVVAVVDRSMIAVKPKEKNKQPVLLRWAGDRWVYSWATNNGHWEEIPDGFFYNDPDREGWWIDRKAPRFGHDEIKYLGLGKAISSWRWKEGRWQGTGPAPTFKE